MYDTVITVDKVKCYWYITLSGKSSTGEDIYITFPVELNHKCSDCQYASFEECVSHNASSDNPVCDRYHQNGCLSTFIEHIVVSPKQVTESVPKFLDELHGQHVFNIRVIKNIRKEAIRQKEREQQKFEAARNKLIAMHSGTGAFEFFGIGF